MKVRDQNVMIVCEHASHMPLAEMAQALHLAIIETDAEGLVPDHDPAVVLLAGLLGFRVHTDTIPHSQYPELLELVQERMNEVPVLH